jgi:radical SAM superfamily enzyme YgiQ (UPF0313 family)
MSKSLYIIDPRNDFPNPYTLEALASQGLQLQHFGDLAVTTVAGLAPPEFSISLCEETVSHVDLDTPCDFVLITGKAGQNYRMVRLAREFRKRGKVVILGGPFASMNPDFLRPYCDVLVRGELENIAQELFSDLQCSTWKDEYVGDKPDLANTVVPRWELYPNDRTIMAAVQTSRGCPFQCEFCDVIVLLGRKQRHKPVSLIHRELDCVHEHGYRQVFLADDNLTVYRTHAKELAVAIREWNERQFAGKLKFSTQVSIDSARDAELLELWSRAGLTHSLVGIETPNEDSLRETRKKQNVGVDLVALIEKMLAHGIGVLAGMVIGFDSDGLDIFERQYEFAMASPVPIFNLNTLIALPGTPLFDRLKKQGRLQLDLGTEYILGRTNFVLAQMSSEELEIGFKWLVNRLYEPKAFEHRLLRLIDELEPVPGVDDSKSDLQPRVDALVLAGIRELGSSEAAMIDKVWSRIGDNPRASHVTLEFLRLYQQLRFMYQHGGIWDPDIAKAELPFHHSCVSAVAS